MRHHANNATCGRVRRGKASLLQRYTRRLAAIILRPSLMKLLLLV